MSFKTAKSYYKRNEEQAIEKLAESIDNLASAINKLAGILGIYIESIQNQSQEHPKEEHRETKRRKRRSSLEILKDEKIAFLKDFSSKIRNVNDYIRYIKNKGAIVVEGTNDIALIDPDFAKKLFDTIDGFKGSADDLVNHLKEKFSDVSPEKIERLVELLHTEAIILPFKGTWHVTTQFDKT